MAYKPKEIEIIFQTILERVSEGESVRNILAEKTMPDKNTFYKWLDASPLKIEQYARACDERTELKFESIEKDYMETPQRDPESGRIDNAWVSLQRLKIDAKKWELSKTNPKKYSEKTTVDTTVKVIDISFED
jgi:hypothetical protein|tara:strand:- start:1292 stop:1690 length:399 start_codon:yes stop_codon:yes gene_type:complete